MYFKQTNPVAVRSQHMIADALAVLMERQSFQQITVTQICQEAGIGRKTFYRNFEWKEDVIRFRVDSLFADYEAEMASVPAEQMLCRHFSFMKRHVAYLTLLYRSGLLPILSEKFRTILPAVMPVWAEDPVEQEYLSSYMAAGVESIFRVWVARGFTETVDQVVEMAAKAQLSLISAPSLSSAGTRTGTASHAGFA